MLRQIKRLKTQVREINIVSSDLFNVSSAEPVIYVTFNRNPKKPLSPSNGSMVWLDEDFEELQDAIDSVEEGSDEELELDFDTEIEWIEIETDYEEEDEE